MKAPGPSPALFFETINSYQRTKALHAAIELELFSSLSRGPRTAGEMAAFCSTSPRGTRILAD